MCTKRQDESKNKLRERIDELERFVKEKIKNEKDGVKRTPQAQTFLFCCPKFQDIYLPLPASADSSQSIPACEMVTSSSPVVSSCFSLDLCYFAW